MQKMAVIGTGTMGIGIAYIFAANGWTSTIVVPEQSQQELAYQQIVAIAADGVRQGKVTEPLGAKLIGNIDFKANVLELPNNLDLIIESASETFELKQNILRQSEAVNPKVLATSTSSLSIKALAKTLVAPEKFLGLHFFNPAWDYRVVEVLKGPLTGSSALSATQTYLESIDKESAVISDSPGYATNRLELIVALEAMRMVEAKVATPTHIDLLMKSAYGHPVGPLELSDIVGLDIRLDFAISLSEDLGERFAPPQLLIELVKAGKLGKKSGEGFYKWTL